jgi:hypothetical protein
MRGSLEVGICPPLPLFAAAVEGARCADAVPTTRRNLAKEPKRVDEA